ncbi:hypothetical protein UJ101_00405 [Flavobacteriaceae bacterium UJ101]|nr:hypothetical protein UJ101_00405 [Flavobacteriaceae bacterium UJ101]
MSYRGDNYVNSPGFLKFYKGKSYKDTSEEELITLFHKILAEGIYGICFSAYEEGQKPGHILNETQVRRRMKIIAPYIKAVRSFSCVEGNELIPKIAKDFGLKTMVGAWIGDEQDKNRIEVESLIQLANEGLVDTAVVGNEVLYRNDISKEELIDWIQEVRERVPSHIPVGYVDAYYEFNQHPDLSDLCDVILANYYPFWESSHINEALPNIHRMHHISSEAGKGKKIMVTETGWPSAGENLDAAVPSRINALRYFVEVQMWAKQHNVELFYFSSFDESWKVGPEGDVGAYWGLWDKHENLKYQKKMINAS